MPQNNCGAFSAREANINGGILELSQGEDEIFPRKDLTTERYICQWFSYVQHQKDLNWLKDCMALNKVRMS